MGTIHKQKFFDCQVHMEGWKNGMSGKNEEQLIGMLEDIGFKLGRDFFRQHPIGSSIVVDMAFINEQVAIEMDGREHLSKKRIKLDEKRDRFLIQNNWQCIRINDSNFKKNPSFYKFLVKYIVEERRKQYETGDLSLLDILEFDPENY